jgi:CBS domain containing-hemolysin-like protein
MRRGRIHRVLVADPPGRVIGIVSSLDILAALAEESARRY